MLLRDAAGYGSLFAFHFSVKFVAPTQIVPTVVSYADFGSYRTFLVGSGLHSF